MEEQNLKRQELTSITLKHGMSHKINMGTVGKVKTCCKTWSFFLHGFYHRVGYSTKINGIIISHSQNHKTKNSFV